MNSNVYITTVFNRDECIKFLQTSKNIMLIGTYTSIVDNILIEMNTSSTYFYSDDNFIIIARVIILSIIGKSITIPTIPDRSVEYLRGRKTNYRIAAVDYYNHFQLTEYPFFRGCHITTPEKADIIIGSLFGNDITKYEHFPCRKILFNAEANRPIIGNYDLIIDTVKRDGTLWIPYFYWSGFELNKVTPKVNSRSRFCSFVYSNNAPMSIRSELFQLLNIYRMVDACGGFQNNTGKIVAPGYDNLINHYSESKFVISCENANIKGYVTEKLLTALLGGGIPIYWGPREVKSIVNPKRFIYVDDFPTLSDLLDHIIFLDNNDAEYNKIINEPMFLPSRWDNYEEFQTLIFGRPYYSHSGQDRYLLEELYVDIYDGTYIEIGNPNNTKTLDTIGWERCQDGEVNFVSISTSVDKVYNGEYVWTDDEKVKDLYLKHGGYKILTIFDPIPGYDKVQYWLKENHV